MARKKAESSGKPEMEVKAYYITKEQYEYLRWRAYHKNINQSQSVREAIDLLISREEGYAPQAQTG